MAPRCLLPALTLVAFGCSHVKGETAAPEGPVVKGITIQGAKRLDEDDIKKKILTTETPWWGRIWPFHEVHTFDPNAWQADLRRIERYYQAQGYYQAQVLHDEVNPDGEDAVRLRVEVTEGQPTHIANVDIRGLESLPKEHQDAALKDLPLHQGAVFHEEDWAGLKQKIQSALRELGYAEASVEGEVRVDVVTRQADIQLSIDPGQRYRFGAVFVTQEDRPKVPSLRVIEQAQGAIRTSDWYSESALAEAQARVFKMGVFGGVKVNRGAPQREAGTIPIVVDVREAPFHTQKLGGGFGVDQTRNEGRVLGEYTDRNFFGGLRRLTVRAKVGYAFIPGVISWLAPQETQAQQPSTGWTLDTLAQLEQPRLFARDVRGQVTIGAQKGLEQAFQYLEGRAKAGVIWQPVPEFSVFPSLNYELYRLSGVLTQSTTLGSQGLGCLPDQTGSCNVALSYGEVAVEYDRRDDRAEPRNGYYAALSIQAGGKMLLGDFNYLRVQPEVRAYKTFQPLDRLTLAAKIKLGTLVPLAGTPESPIVARFYSGGATSMRGFDTRRLSPMLLVPTTGSTGGFATTPLGLESAETIPIGGNGLFESSIEARYRFTSSLSAALFLDAGFVSVDSFNFADAGFIPRNTLFAVGIGARYLTPVGPIRIDIARRLDVGAPLPLIGPGNLVPMTRPGCFGLLPPRDPAYAGSPEGQCAFHLSIGEAF
ncbi:MAG TPA: BamA/TamA family outer membrane protein [Myxococcaceae bacterium]|nr:BamA/TamA family outer membrane protein [Myxococcaceae bacterium]